MLPFVIIDHLLIALSYHQFTTLYETANHKKILHVYAVILQTRRVGTIHRICHENLSIYLFPCMIVLYVTVTVHLRMILY